MRRSGRPDLKPIRARPLSPILHSACYRFAPALGRCDRSTEARLVLAEAQTTFYGTQPRWKPRIKGSNKQAAIWEGISPSRTKWSMHRPQVRGASRCFSTRRSIRPTRAATNYSQVFRTKNNMATTASQWETAGHFLRRRCCIRGFNLQSFARFNPSCLAFLSAGVNCSGPSSTLSLPIVPVKWKGTW